MVQKVILLLLCFLGFTVNTHAEGNAVLSYVYQLQNANYASLAAMDFNIAVVDPDDAELSAAQVSALENSGKTLFAYLSIGEAEDYRDYWINHNWYANPPDFLLKENPNWPGNYNVKFWKPEWQAIILARIKELVKAGYSGVYLDIVEAYQVLEVQKAYDGESGDIRKDMEAFVLKISQTAKAVNPRFKVVPQNAVELLSLNDGPTKPNTRYLAAIDGAGKEDTWTDDDEVASWAKWDLEYLAFAKNAGKFVLVVDYPTVGTLQEAFIRNAIKAGFIPFVGTRELDGTIAPVNYKIPSQLPEKLMETVR